MSVTIQNSFPHWNPPGEGDNRILKSSLDQISDTVRPRNTKPGKCIHLGKVAGHCNLYFELWPALKKNLVHIISPTRTTNLVHLTYFEHLTYIKEKPTKTEPGMSRKDCVSKICQCDTFLDQWHTSKKNVVRAISCILLDLQSTDILMNVRASHIQGVTYIWTFDLH